MRIIQNYISPNFHAREPGADIRYIILHYTEMLFDDAVQKLCDREAKVSAHYIIRDNGEIYQLVHDKYAAWHAGISSWNGLDFINQYSIGIEIDNSGSSEFTQEQMYSCVILCKKLMDLYCITQENIIGHSDVSPDRKIDPGIFFNWRYMAKYGIGMWYDELHDTSHKPFSYVNYQTLQTNLRKIGYKIDITRINDAQTNHVIRAFQSHFCPEVIWGQGGIDFYRNADSVYEWNHISESIMQAILSRYRSRDRCC